MTLNERIDALEGRLQAADATLRLMRNAPMARYTTLHLGGPASLLACPEKPEQVQLLQEQASSNSLRNSFSASSPRWAAASPTA